MARPNHCFLEAVNEETRFKFQGRYPFFDSINKGNAIFWQAKSSG